MTLIAKVIAEIALVEMDRDEEIKDGRNLLNKTSPSLIKVETEKLGFKWFQWRIFNRK